MPLYELRCESCGEVVEVILDLSEVPSDHYKIIEIVDFKCEKCGETKFKRLFSAHGTCPINWAAWRLRK